MAYNWTRFQIITSLRNSLNWSRKTGKWFIMVHILGSTTVNIVVIIAQIEQEIWNEFIVIMVKMNFLNYFIEIIITNDLSACSERSMKRVWNDCSKPFKNLRNTI